MTEPSEWRSIGEYLEMIDDDDDDEEQRRRSSRATQQSAQRRRESDANGVAVPEQGVNFDYVSVVEYFRAPELGWRFTPQSHRVQAFFDRVGERLGFQPGQVYRENVRFDGQDSPLDERQNWTRYDPDPQRVARSLRLTLRPEVINRMAAVDADWRQTNDFSQLPYSNYAIYPAVALSLNGSVQSDYIAAVGAEYDLINRRSVPTARGYQRDLEAARQARVRAQVQLGHYRWDTRARDFVWSDTSSYFDALGLDKPRSSSVFYVSTAF